MPPVTSELFRSQSASILADLADELGCEPADLASEKFVVVPRPANSRHNNIVLIATAGLGTVVSVVPGLLGWVRENPPEGHFRALRSSFLEQLAIEARNRSWPIAGPSGLSLGFALAEALPPPAAPDGLSLRLVDPDWMARYRDSQVFDNALGEPGEEHVPPRLGYALLDASSEPIAIAGIWTQGTRRDEIGVDVRRDYRGRGLAPVVVLAAVRDILDRGRTPFYSISATNVRSHRNALACGFLPVSAWATVAERAGPSVATPRS